MIDDWNDLKLVLAIARSGALTRAAGVLHIDHSTVYRRLQALERRLGTKLFERSPSGEYRPTAAGTQMAAAAERIEAETQLLGRTVLGQDQRLTGRLKVTSSETLAYRLLTDQIARFRVTHPGILVELVVDNRVLSLSRREADIALRPMRPQEPGLFGRKLADVEWAVYATNRLVRIDADDPFGGLPVIGWGEEVNSIRAASWVAKHASDARIVYRSSSLINQLVAARAGLGAALMPCYLGDPEPDLARLGAPRDEVRGELWIVTHDDLRTTARVRAFLELVGEGLIAHRSVIEGQGVPADLSAPYSSEA